MDVWAKDPSILKMPVPEFPGLSVPLLVTAPVTVPVPDRVPALVTFPMMLPLTIAVEPLAAAKLPVNAPAVRTLNVAPLATLLVGAV